jgi:type I restriction enzyme S subunit
MNADRLLELYERISDAPDAVVHLRRFVLDLAVRGKLVEQDVADEPASELLKRIAAEKARLVKAAEIRKPKNFKPIDTEPFLLPRSWVWVRLGELGETQTGATPPKSHSEFYGTDIPFLRPGDLYPRYVDYTGEGLSLSGVAASGRLAPSGSILMVCIGTIGKSQIIDRNSSFNQQINALTPFSNLDGTFLLRVIQSSFFQAAAWDASAKTTIAILNKGNWEKLPFPLPPLAEQRRIVAKVDELMALCDRLEEGRGTREALRDRLTTAGLARLTAPDADPEAFGAHARFALQTLTALTALTARPDQIKTLRQTILNLAVRGKLVEQDPTDEPASELLQAIAKEKALLVKAGAIPRKKEAVRDHTKLVDDLPASWSPISLGVVCNLVTSGSRGWAEFYANSGPSFIRAQNIRFGRLKLDGLAHVNPPANSEGSRTQVVKGDLVIVITGAGVTNPAMLNHDPGEAYVSQHVGLVRPTDTQLSVWILLCLMADAGGRAELVERAYGAGKPGLNLDNIRSLSIPLPPLAEQHRIVAKVDALMALCDRLEAALATADTTRRRLLEALLHEALEPSATHEMETAG